MVDLYKNRNRSQQSRRRCIVRRRGVATVEAAIMLPILIVVSLGSTDVAQYINLAQTVTNASRQGARFASRDATETVQNVETAVRDFFKQTYPRTSAEVLDAAIEVNVSHLDGSKINQGDLTSIESGDPVVVQVDFNFDSVRWFKGLNYLGSEVRQSQTIGRRE